MKNLLVSDIDTNRSEVLCENSDDKRDHTKHLKQLLLIGMAMTILSNFVLTSCSIIEWNEPQETENVMLTESKISTSMEPTSEETTKETVIEVDNNVLNVNIGDYKTMITPTFDTLNDYHDVIVPTDEAFDAIDSFTIDNMSIIGNQYYADLSTEEYILTSPKNVELITKGVEYSQRECEFTNALLEIGGQVYNCSLDKSNYATVNGVTNETFIVYDTNNIENTVLDSNSKILTTAGARAEYKTISEEEYEKMDLENYNLGIISIGPNDIILENVKVVSSIEGTDDMVITGKSAQYGLCLFKTSKYNIVLEKTIDDSTINPEVEGTTIDFLGRAYINYKFCYDETTLYHLLNSVTITKDGMFYCYGEKKDGTKVFTIMSSDLSNIESDLETTVLPEQENGILFNVSCGLSFNYKTFTNGACSMSDNTTKEIEGETYICGNSKYNGGDYKGKSFLSYIDNLCIFDLNSGNISTKDSSLNVPDAINPINFIFKAPKGSYATTLPKINWGSKTTKGVISSMIGTKKAYIIKVLTHNTSKESSTYYCFTKPIEDIIAKGSDEDLQKILTKN